MEGFSIGKVYEDEFGVKTVDINPLPANYCSFDCVFCPLGRTVVKTDKSFKFKETEEFKKTLEEFLNKENVDMVFINPDGESLANKELIDIVNIIKAKGKKVRLLSNGYIFNNEEYREVLEQCDEVIGELSVVEEEDFKKLLRPLKEYSLSDYIHNMCNFRAWFKGKFILDVTILKNYSNGEEQVKKLNNMIKKIKPDEVFFGTPDGGKLGEAFGVSLERLEEIKNTILNT